MNKTAAMASKPLRIVFAGTPDFAAAHLSALLQSPHQVIAVFTQPDRPAGRGRKLAVSPVKALASAHGIPVHQPLTLKTADDQSLLAELAPDLMIVVAYGLILPQAVLDIPRLGCINVHASLLPRWRGAAPIQRAIEAGDTESGICIMQMEAGLDTGPVLLERRCAIQPADTGASLHDRLAELGPPALLETVTLLASGQALAHPQQDGLATYAHKLGKDEAQLDFARPAPFLSRQIRAFNSFPVSWCSLPSGERLRIWQAHPDSNTRPVAPGTVLACAADGLQITCGEGSLIVTELQLPNRTRMAIRDIMNGHLLNLQPGDLLS